MEKHFSLIDERGVIRQALTVLPASLRGRFVEILAELEDVSCYQKKQFPKTKLKRIKGTKVPIYCANIDDLAKWQLYLYYQDGKLYLQEIRHPFGKEKKDSLDLIAELNDF